MSSPDTVQSRRDILPFAMFTLPDIFMEKAETELRETTYRKKESLYQLKEILKKDECMGDIHFEDDYLVQFLRRGKYDVKRAFQNVRHITKLRKQHGYLFQRISLDCFSKNPSIRFVSVLPKRCPDGCTIVLGELSKWDPDEFLFDDFRRLTVSVLLQALRFPMTQVNGYKLIGNFKGLTSKYLKYCTPFLLHQMYHTGMNCIPARYKEIHFVYDSIVFQLFWSIFRNFLPQKIKKRVVFHKTPDTLLEYFSPFVLPVEYGGELKDYYDADFAKRLHQQYDPNALGGQPNFTETL